MGNGVIGQERLLLSLPEADNRLHYRYAVGVWEQGARKSVSLAPLIESRGKHNDEFC